MDYFDDAKNIWKQFVPPAGQSGTVQGELLRAVEKLRDEAIRNGNCNWDKGFEILLSYLDHHLEDDQVFTPETLDKIRAILHRLNDWKNPLLEDAPYDFLGDRVVDYFRHYGSKPHAHNPALWR